MRCYSTGASSARAGRVGQSPRCGERGQDTLTIPQLASFGSGQTYGVEAKGRWIELCLPDLVIDLPVTQNGKE
jgi:hypothetical protein